MLINSSVFWSIDLHDFCLNLIKYSLSVYNSADIQKDLYLKCPRTKNKKIIV